MVQATTSSSKKAIRKLVSKDLFSITLIQDPQISPDGTKILYVHKTFKPKKNEYESKIHFVPFDGKKQSRPWSRGPADEEPCFSPDGESLAFTAKVGDFRQLFVMPCDGGEGRQVTHFKNNVSQITWSPDGKRIAFVVAITDKGLIPEDEKPEEDLYEKYNQDVKVIRRIWYKMDGEGFVHNKRHQIFVVDLETEAVKQITHGEHEANTPQFSPDGESIVFSSNRNRDSDHEPFGHIYLVPSHGGEPKNLTPGNFFFSNPIFSPDGKWIAFTGTDEPMNWYANFRLWIVPADGGKPECLTLNFDRPVGDQSINDLRALSHGETPRWNRDNRTIYITMSDSGAVFLAAVDRDTKAIKEFGRGEQVVFGWSTAQNVDRAVLGKSDPVTPNDLWSLELASNKLERLTKLNDRFLETAPISTPERFQSTSPDGTKVEGWILKPADFESGKKYPAIFEIHGGPMAMYGWSFFYEFQLLANHGYVIIYTNPRGSMGYGQPFCEAIKGDWGNRDYQDLSAALDVALKTGFIDEARLGVAGGSYGGFMTNWVVGHTDRFKAAVTMRSVTNEHSFFGTSDFGFWGDMNLGSLPWDKPEAYLRMSPITYVKNIKTPLLILHSEEDHRCPVEQAEQLFASLKKMKRETVFIRFPGESHDLSRTGKPWHRIYRLDRILEWFDKYLK